jgi:hypothetical protein
VAAAGGRISLADKPGPAGHSGASIPSESPRPLISLSRHDICLSPHLALTSRGWGRDKCEPTRARSFPFCSPGSVAGACSVPHPLDEACVGALDGEGRGSDDVWINRVADVCLSPFQPRRCGEREKASSPSRSWSSRTRCRAQGWCRTLSHLHTACWQRQGPKTSPKT